ncbi:MAG: hypothetical protein LBU11_04140 [Zoogloeaceae bacterium]|jgi:hypothetical protein|nr:hypothetical protein [Zoogloeaceae bacterium]
MLKSLQCLVLALCLTALPVMAEERLDVEAEQALLGDHLFSLQWVSWEKFGKASVTRRDGVLHMNARQELDGDYVTAEGTITIIDAREFILKGEVTTRVSHINDGQPCGREGEWHFKVTGTRRYWRMQEMDNPCDEVTDYVDVFFK